MLNTLRDLKDIWDGYVYVPENEAEEALYVEKLQRLNRFMDRVLIVVVGALLLLWGGAGNVFFG